jgi:hypothetical protein
MFLQIFILLLLIINIVLTLRVGFFLVKISDILTKASIYKEDENEK